jgi:probable HAF family extracellular repeat protein
MAMARAAGFTPMDFSEAVAVANNGLAIAGRQEFVIRDNNGFPIERTWGLYWAPGKIEWLTPQENQTNSDLTPQDISTDGTTVVGRILSDTDSTPFYWNSSLATLQSVLPVNQYGSANAVTIVGNDIVIVGTRDSVMGAEAFRRSNSGVTGLGDLDGGIQYSEAFDVSSDGNVVVGVSSSTSGIEGEAFRWSDGTMIGLGDLSGGDFFSQANAISADGGTIVGWSNSGNGMEASRWTQAEGMRELGDLPGGEFLSTAFDVSADGRVIVGTSDSAAGVNDAFIWIAGFGIQRVADVLLQQRIYVEDMGWELFSANGISDDGRYIVGTGSNAFGEVRGWLAEIDLPSGLRGDFNRDGMLDATDIDELTREVRRGAHSESFDLNSDRQVNAEDRRIWIEEVRRTHFGDSNLDGEFNSTDFVVVFTLGEYEDSVVENSLWLDGDWNGDAEFGSSDFVLAFQAGGYETGPRAANFVPEPTWHVGVLIGLFVIQLCWARIQLSRATVSLARS